MKDKGPWQDTAGTLQEKQVEKGGNLPGGMRKCFHLSANCSILSDDGMKFPVTEEQKGSRYVVQRRGSQSIYVLQTKWNRGEE